MKPISIESIPHEMHRYDTCGDWYEHEGKNVIRVSVMGNKDYEFLVALHELIEMRLCHRRGITQEQVDEFDMAHPELEEPGNDPACPCYREHSFATLVERLVAMELGVDWNQYEEALGALEWEKGEKKDENAT